MNKHQKSLKIKNFLIFLMLLLLFSFYGCVKKDKNTDNTINKSVDNEEKVPLTPDVVLHDEIKPRKKTNKTDQVIEGEKQSNKKTISRNQNHYGKIVTSRYHNFPKNLTFERVYGEKINPPDTDFNINLEDKSLAELRLLRNQVFARKGYMFSNSVVRGYFNQFDWYQPVYWEEDFEINTTPEENQFIDKILIREKELLAQNTTEIDGLNLYNYDNAVNLIQFKNIPAVLTEKLKKQNYALNPGKDDQLWHIYDRNVYAGIPSFITTDLYLQLIHIHYKYLLKRLEKQELMGTLQALILALYEENVDLYKNSEEDSQLKECAKFNVLYLGIAGNLLTDGLLQIPDGLRGIYEEEFTKADSCKGKPSEFVGFPYFDYSQLKPRGHYAGDPEFERYFKSVRWLLSFPFKVKEDDRLASMILIARAINKSNINKHLYNSFDVAVGAFAGDEDNLSLTNLTKILEEDYSGISIENLLTKGNLLKIRSKLLTADPEKMKAVGGTAAIQAKLNEPKMYFMALRYNFDGAILQKLVYAEPEREVRPYPKGLDIFATMGDEEAERILVDIYKEAENWPEYADRLAKLQEDMQGNIDWDKSVYNKRMQLVLTLQYIDENLPGFMQTKAWQRKNLSTTLAAWTHIKHEMVLYIKQPIMAQAGEGGGAPPPVVPSYVEPNTRFWSTSIEVLNHTKDLLSAHDLWKDDDNKFHNKLEEIAGLLLDISNKELNRQRVTDEEMVRLMWLPAEIEHLSLAIMGPYTDPKDRVPLVIDVYTRLVYDECLEEAIGYADEIYVLTEINGLVYLTRGSVFSVYEFKQPTRNRLTDKKWREKLRAGEIPSRPVWVQDNISSFNSLVAKSHYSFNSYPVTAKWRGY